MTLILTIANSGGLYQSSDYQLTDVIGQPQSDKAGSKQLDAMVGGMNLQLAFTGVAVIKARGSTDNTIDWLSTELKSLPPKSDLQTICDLLARRCAAKMQPLGSNGVLTLVLGVAAPGQQFRVAVISNAQWSEIPPKANANFDIQIQTAKKPLRLISGYRNCVPVRERQRLKALARATDKSPKEILDALAEINAVAAQNSRGCVSKGCWLASQVASADRRRIDIQMHSVGDHDGSVTQIIGGIDVLDIIKKNFKTSPGAELRLKPLGAVLGGGVPLPPPEGETLTFMLSGSVATDALRCPSGQQCAMIEINQLETAITMRRNERVTVLFAKVGLSAMSTCADFPLPLLPWSTINPALRIDGVTVPRGWEYSVGYAVQQGIHKVTLPRMSRGIRNLAFLGNDDELVIAVDELELTLGPSGDKVNATAHADISWRTRPDGTRG